MPDGSCASDSDSSLLVDGHAHALPPQSGHLFHDLFFVSVFLRGLFHALLAATEWSFCGWGFLVSECIGRGPFLSSSTGRVGVMGGFGGGVAVDALVRGSLGRGWALWACRLPSRLSSRVGVLFRHLMHIVAPACVAARILVFLQRAHAPSGALSVRDMAICMSHARISVMGRVVDIADSMGHPLVRAISLAITKIPQEVPSVCWTDSHTSLVLDGRMLGGWERSVRRAVVR